MLRNVPRDTCCSLLKTNTPTRSSTSSWSSGSATVIMWDFSTVSVKDTVSFLFCRPDVRLATPAITVTWGSPGLPRPEQVLLFTSDSHT